LSRDSRRSQEENESKRGEKKARHIEKEKQVSQMPKHSAACSVYWGMRIGGLGIFGGAFVWEPAQK